MTDQTGPVRIEVLLTPQDAQRIDAWRLRNRVASRVEAVRHLLQQALAADRASNEPQPEAQPDHGRRRVGPEDEDRAGPQAPDPARRTQSP